MGDSVSAVKNMLILILLLAIGLSIFLGHAVEAIAIAVIVVFAVLLGFVQEYRAERAIDALRQMAAPNATVIRDGRELSVPAHTLVPGDLIVLQTGDKIPADGRLTSSINLQVEESALTGESVPVGKQTAPLDTGDLAIGDRTNMVHAGTAVTYGRGRAIVVATAMQTEFGQIAQLLQTVETAQTPLQANLHRVGVVLARAALVIVALIVALGLSPWPALDRDAHLWHCVGGGSGSRGVTCRGHHLARPRRPAHGQAQCPGTPPAGRGNAGQHLGHLLG